MSVGPADSALLPKASVFLRASVFVVLPQRFSASIAFQQVKGQKNALFTFGLV